MRIPDQLRGVGWLIILNIVKAFHHARDCHPQIDLVMAGVYEGRECYLPDWPIYDGRWHFIPQRETREQSRKWYEFISSFCDWRNYDHLSAVKVPVLGYPDAQLSIVEEMIETSVPRGGGLELLAKKLFGIPLDEELPDDCLRELGKAVFLLPMALAKGLINNPLAKALRASPIVSRDLCLKFGREDLPEPVEVAQVSLNNLDRHVTTTWQSFLL